MEVLNKLIKIGVIDHSKRKVGAILLISILTSFIEAIGIGLVYPIIAIVQNINHPFLDKVILVYFLISGIVLSHKNAVLIIFITGIIFFILKGLITYLIQKKIADFISLKQTDLSSKVFSNIINSSYSFYLQNDSSSFARMINMDCNYIIGLILIPLLSMVTDIISIVLIISYLLYINISSGILVLALGGIIMYIFNKVLSERQKITGEKALVNSGKMLKYSQESVSLIKEIKLSHKVNYFRKRFDNVTTEYSQTQKNVQVYNLIPKIFIEAIFTIALLAVLLYSYLNNFSKEVLTLIILYAASLYKIMPSLNNIIRARNSIKVALPQLDAISQLLDKIVLEPKIQDKKHPKLRFSKKIDFNDISFSYENSKQILENVTFSINKNTLIGIMGRSGAGKSTLVNILTGLIKQNSGEIVLDGKHSILTDLSGWQASIGYVPQNIVLLDLSIRENVAFGVPAELINDEKIMEALRKSSLIDFVTSLPFGIYSNVGENGKNLSGGQRQRLGIARAFYTDPELLIFDEATSGLDHKSESEVLNSIHEMKNSVTIIMISHNLKTLAGCDEIIMLNEKNNLA